MTSPMNCRADMLCIVMTTITLQLSLPDDLAREAEMRGLLEPDFLASLLRREAWRRRGEQDETSRIESAVERAQELVRPYVGEGASMVDQLLEDRRLEARGE